MGGRCRWRKGKKEVQTYRYVVGLLLAKVCAYEVRPGEELGTSFYLLTDLLTDLLTETQRQGGTQQVPFLARYPYTGLPHSI